MIWISMIRVDWTGMLLKDFSFMIDLSVKLLNQHNGKAASLADSR